MQDAGLDGDDTLVVAEPPPHLAVPAQEVPDLLDRPMCNGDGRLTGRELKVRHATGGDTEQDTHIRAVGRGDVGLVGKRPRLHCVPPSVVTRSSEPAVRVIDHRQPANYAQREERMFFK